MADLVTFSSPPERDGSNITATLDSSVLVNAITSGDEYLDQTQELGQVSVYYQHGYNLDGTWGGREEKKLIFFRDETFQTPVSWSTQAQDGTWEQNLVRVYGREGSDSSYIDGTGFTGLDLILT